MNYTRKTISGEQQYRRVTKQGAPRKPDELKEKYTVIIHMTKSEYDNFMRAKSDMKASAFGRLILFFGLESYLNQIDG